MSLKIHSLMDVDLIDEFPDDRGRQFGNLRSAAHDFQKAVNAVRFGLCPVDQIMQLGNPSFKLRLLLLVAGRHLGESLVGDFSVDVILVKPLDDRIQFLHTGFCLIQFALSIPEALCHLFL